MKNQLKIVFNDGQLIASFFGEIDNTNSFIYKNKLLEAIEEYSFKKLIFNFSEVNFIDSSGLGLILGRLNQLEAHEIKMEIINVNTYVLKLLNMSGLASIVTSVKEIVYE